MIRKRQVDKQDEIQEVDCSLGEGGGQIVRNASTYACLLSKSLNLKRIRADREKPGLQPQHMTSLKILSQISNTVFSGVGVGSTCVCIQSPKELKHKSSNFHKGRESIFEGSTGTAGSLVLVIQAALPCALFHKCPCVLELEGGTNAKMAPQIDYFTNVFLPITKRILHPTTTYDDDIPSNANEVVHCDIIKRGYYPKGGGLVRLKINPIYSIEPFSLIDRGIVKKVNILAWTAGRCPKSVAYKMANRAKEMLLSDSKELQNSTITKSFIDDSKAQDSASGILLTAETDKGIIIAGSSLGKRNMKPEVTAANATIELFNNLQHGGCVDEWLQDQLILYMALADGESILRTGPLTLHTQTAIRYATEICGASFIVTKVDSGDAIIEVDGFPTDVSESSCKVYGKGGKIDGCFIIRCKGIGLKNLCATPSSLSTKVDA